MDPLREYAQFWIEGTALQLGHPNWHELHRYWISNIESGRPGFAAQLRLAARDLLEGESYGLAVKAIAALAVVGDEEDVVSLRAAAARFGSEAAKAAYTAIFEIEHRARAS